MDLGMKSSGKESDRLSPQFGLSPKINLCPFIVWSPMNGASHIKELLRQDP